MSAAPERRAWWLVCLGFPALFAAIAVARGQDANWDLLNYHWVNAYVLLSGRVGKDLAVAGLQSYFNPLVDLPYFLLNQWLAPRAAGAVLGAWHGLGPVVAYAIGREVFPGRWKASMALAAAGALGANFLSEVGTSMGDDTVAPFLLAGAWCSLKALQVDVAPRRWVVAGALLAGAAVGLKLTLAPIAVALGVAYALASSSYWKGRAVSLVSFGALVAVGFGLVGGAWLWRMWDMYGNPLFPQFGNIFPSDLTSAQGATDTSWLPHGWIEFLSWPFIVSMDPLRSGQLPVRTITWGVFYAVGLAAVIAALVKSRRGSMASMHPAPRLLVTWLAMSLLLWTATFGVFRYLAPVELVLPIGVWLLVEWISEGTAWRWTGAALLVLSALFTLSAAGRTWGHRGWADRPLAAERPALEDPSGALILMTSVDPPQGWLVTAFPREVSFALANHAFPEGPGFASELRSRVTGARSVYALVPAPPPGGHDTPLTAAAVELAELGREVPAGGCRSYGTAIGQKKGVYRLCRTTLLPAVDL